MEPVDLLEDEHGIFTATVNRTLYTMFRNNSVDFSDMISKQGNGYWIKFCTTLKAVLENEGYNVLYVKAEDNYLQFFFIKLLDTLTLGKPEYVVTLVKDVVSVARHSELFRALKLYGSCKHGTENIFSDSIIRLFGNSSDSNIWSKLPLYLRAVGSLLKIFELWLETKSAEHIKWKPPRNWFSNNLYVSREYEIQLKNIWGEELLEMLDVKKEDICWWKNACKIDAEGVLLRKKSSSLGRKIITVIVKSMANIELFAGLMSKATSLIGAAREKNRFHRHHIIKNFLRGAVLIFSQENYATLFLAACYREMCFTSSLETFHPYSQFMIGFFNTTYGPRFWKAIDSCTLEPLPSSKPASSGNIELLMKFMGLGKKPEKSKQYVEAEILRTYVSANEMRSAIYLNSRFYDCVATSTTWDSPETIVRLLWNMPLCLNWLEILLLQIYEFESCFLPFIHFPLQEDVKRLAEELYVVCKTSRFLAKSSIIVAEYIYMNADNDAGRCYDARLMLEFTISLLVPKMKFLIGPCYQVLEVIFRESYGDKEAKNDDRVFVNTHASCSIPDIDDIFDNDRRSVNYWLARGKNPPSLHQSLDYFPHCLKVLQDYKNNFLEVSSKKNQHKKLSDALHAYNKKTYAVTCADAFDIKSPSSVEDKVRFVMDMFDLLVEDQWMKRDDIVKDTCAELIQKSAYSNIIKKKENNIISELAHLGRVYLVCAALSGDICPEETNTKPEQILFTRLLNAECRSSMADVASRFILTYHQYHQPGSKPHPSIRVLKDARKAIAARNLPVLLDVAEAMNLMSSMEQECYLINDTSLSLPVTCFENVHLDEEYLTYYKWFHSLIDKCSNLHYRLLQQVSRVQFRKAKGNGKNPVKLNSIMFVHQNILEYRIVSEIAAVKKCFKLGMKYMEYTHRLCDLLQYRLQWLVNEVEKWSKADFVTAKVGDSAPTSLRDMIILTRVQTAAALLSLQSVLDAYLPSLTTVHPLPQGYTDVVVDWQSICLFFFKRADGFANETMTEYFESLKVMATDYMSDLLDHCIKAWNVPAMCTDPSRNVGMFSLQHAEKVYTALKHFAFFCGYYLIRENYLDGTMFVYNVVEPLLQAEILLRTAAKDSTVDWKDSCARLKLYYDNIVQGVLHYGKDLKIDDSDIPYWKGYNDKYRSLFKSFLGKRNKADLKCLRIDEFLSEDYGTELEKQVDVSSKKKAWSKGKGIYNKACYKGKKINRKTGKGEGKVVKKSDTTAKTMYKTCVNKMLAISLPYCMLVICLIFWILLVYEDWVYPYISGFTAGE